MGKLIHTFFCGFALPLLSCSLLFLGVVKSQYNVHQAKEISGRHLLIKSKGNTVKTLFLPSEKVKRKKRRGGGSNQLIYLCCLNHKKSGGQKKKKSLSWPSAVGNSGFLLSLRYQTSPVQKSYLRALAFGKFPGCFRIFLSPAYAPSFLRREERMAKAPWRYKCSFDWLNNDSLSQQSDKTLPFSFSHYSVVCVPFRLRCEPGWQSLMA